MSPRGRFGRCGETRNPILRELAFGCACRSPHSTPQTRRVDGDDGGATIQAPRGDFDGAVTPQRSDDLGVTNSHNMKSLRGTTDVEEFEVVQEDVRFRDLGLLIVDEEHRFGVAQKERIRELKAEVDTLYLSATPIPRTLYSALVGLKDLSSIQTPPPGRKPIKTFLAPFDPLLVREAILFELERGGKVFYVHDRVASIEARRRFLENLVPEARIGVVHGQMPESLIEETMLLFAEGAYDVLLATTIIEAGLDVPEANTILIERADRLGLATLYQLRGRVGRREEEAYAYLFLHRHAALVGTAHRRLSAIRQYNQLGAGFRIAMRDLELRGAGNILGAAQSEIGRAHV